MELKNLTITEIEVKKTKDDVAYSVVRFGKQFMYDWNNVTNNVKVGDTVNVEYEKKGKYSSILSIGVIPPPANTNGAEVVKPGEEKSWKDYEKTTPPIVPERQTKSTYVDNKQNSFALAYAKDLVVAGRVELSEIIKVAGLLKGFLDGNDLKDAYVKGILEENTKEVEF